MKSGRMSAVAFAAALGLALSVPSAAQWVTNRTPGIPRTADGRYPLVATSPTTFTVAGTPLEFFKDSQGAVTHFIVRTVEGDQKAVRQAGTPAPAR
jgi:hypothetical protein